MGQTHDERRRDWGQVWRLGRDENGEGGGGGSDGAF